jgi:hypothetical protein
MGPLDKHHLGLTSRRVVGAEVVATAPGMPTVWVSPEAPVAEGQMKNQAERANLGRVLLADKGTATLLMVVAAAVPEG